MVGVSFNALTKTVCVLEMKRIDSCIKCLKDYVMQRAFRNLFLNIERLWLGILFRIRSTGMHASAMFDKVQTVQMGVYCKQQSHNPTLVT